MKEDFCQIIDVTFVNSKFKSILRSLYLDKNEEFLSRCKVFFKNLQGFFDLHPEYLSSLNWNNIPLQDEIINQKFIETISKELNHIFIFTKKSLSLILLNFEYDDIISILERNRFNLSSIVQCRESENWTIVERKKISDVIQHIQSFDNIAEAEAIQEAQEVTLSIV
jgi:hypothetical protein